MPRMMFRNRFEGMGLLGVPPTPPPLVEHLRLHPRRSPRRACVPSAPPAPPAPVAQETDRERRPEGVRRARLQSEARRPRKPRRAGARLSKSAKRRAPTRETKKRRGVVYACPRMGVARDRERVSARWGSETRWRTSSGAGSSCEPARMASSALTVLSASDSEAARTAWRGEPTRRRLWRRCHPPGAPPRRTGGARRRAGARGSPRRPGFGRSSRGSCSRRAAFRGHAARMGVTKSERLTWQQ